MYFDKDGDKIELTDDEIKYGRPCCCSKTVNKDQLHEKGNLYKVNTKSIEFLKLY